MKGLFSGVALAALIAVPVWAQAPTNTQNQNAPSGNPPASAQAPAPSQNAPVASQRKEAAGSEKAAPAKSEKSAAAPRQRGEMRMSHHMSHHARTMRHGHGMAYAHGMRGYGMRSQPMGWASSMSDERRMGWHPHYRMAHHGMYRHYGWYRPHYGWGWGVHAPTDFMAQQLNRQELGQLSGGGMPPSGPPRAGY